MEVMIMKGKLFIVLLSVLLLSIFFSSSASAANIAVLSNYGEAAVAADFTANIPGHTFTGINVAAVTPTLASLLAYDAILLFENGLFGNAINVGNRLAEYANTGRPVILGTFYDQERSDNLVYGQPGWGALEGLDPNTTDGVGCPYAYRSLNPASIVAHPLTTGVTSLWSNSYAGGNQAKPGTTVLATWNQLNNNGNQDPAIAYRVTGQACVIHIAIFPDYPSYGTYGVNFGGDFYQAWKNAFDFAAVKCAAAPKPPTCIYTSPVPTSPTNIGTFSPGLYMSYDPSVLRPFGFEEASGMLTGRLWLPCWQNGNIDIYVVVSQSPYGQLVLNNFGQWLPFPATIVPYLTNTSGDLYVPLFSLLKSGILPGTYGLDVIIVPSGTPASTISQIVSGSATASYYKWSFTKTLP